jgi:hypothetical protein
MPTFASRAVLVLGAAALAVAPLTAEDRVLNLSAKDRAEIQQLAVEYGRALGTCAAQDYARLFEPDGAFASGPRGTVRGRERLMALVESERHCNGAGGDRSPRQAPTMDIKAAPGGAVGIGLLGADGTYVDDTYVKTRNGWRFKLRQVITGAEKSAQLAGADFLAIRRLAGDGSPDYGDVYSNTPDGWRFRSSGVVIAATPSGVTGRAHLKSGGRYDDVYANTPGGWRFQSRTFVAEVASGPQGQAQQVR